MPPKQQFAMVPIERLKLTDNVRREPGDIEDLVESVKQLGILEPLVCCPTADREQVDVLAGQRRLAASRAAGLTEVPCILRQRPAKRERLLMQLAENLQRRDMSPIDEALAFRDLIYENMTQTQIARAVHRQQTYVSQCLRLLKLPECVQVALDIGWIPMSTALAIPAELLDDKAAVKRLAGVLTDGTKAVERWTRNEIDRRTAEEPATPIVRRSGNKTLNITPDAYDSAVTAAMRAGMTITEWASGIILTAAERQARRAS